jgi:conjugative transfer signal peptidase TraF
VNSRMTGLTGWGIAGALGVGWALLWCTGLRLNTSASVPVGLWQETSVNRALHRGDTVSMCPDDSAVIRLAKARGYLKGGWCAGHSEILFKPVAAVAGDVVDVDSMGIRVNGTSVPKSAPLAADEEGRRLPAVASGRYVVGEGELWLVSATNDHSFDSRYFGPIRLSAVRGLLSPLWLKSAW